MPVKLKIEHVAIESLRPNGFNVNIVSPENETKIEESLKRFGFFKPVLCRQVSDEIEIIGGEHRWLAAKRLGHKEVPIINLGNISDNRAKEVSLVDNGRYGADDTLQLAELLEGLGTVEELTAFMPYGETDLASIFSSVNITLDDLDLPDDDEILKAPTARPVQSHQVMRFKVPVADVGTITDMIERVMKSQKFNEGDSLENAGDAFVFICNRSGA